MPGAGAMQSFWVPSAAFGSYSREGARMISRRDRGAMLDNGSHLRHTGPPAAKWAALHTGVGLKPRRVPSGKGGQGLATQSEATGSSVHQTLKTTPAMAAASKLTRYFFISLRSFLASFSICSRSFCVSIDTTDLSLAFS